MMDKQTIDNLIAKEDYKSAIEALDANINEEPKNALWYYLRGKIKWRLGDKGAAMTDYENAVSLDPQSPAKAALEMSRDIMDFFNPDIFNP